MYQTNTAFRIPNTFILDRNRERKAVFYGRVSTEHEAQLAALENQMHLPFHKRPVLWKIKCSGMTTKQNITRTGLS